MITLVAAHCHRCNALIGRTDDPARPIYCHSCNWKRSFEEAAAKEAARRPSTEALPPLAAGIENRLAGSVARASVGGLEQEKTR